MKNFKLYAILSLCFGMLFLTGCGGGDTPTVTCSMEENGQKATFKITYDKEEKNPQSVEMTVSVEIPDGTSKEDIENAKEAVEVMYCSNDDIKCNVKQNGNSLDITLAGDLDDLVDAGMLQFDEDEDSSLEALLKEAEEEGAKCTKSYE